jgi:hypothetical protein
VLSWQQHCQTQTWLKTHVWQIVCGM